MPPPDLNIPENLETIVLEQFDDLVSKRQLLWESSNPDIFTDDDFQFEVRILPILAQKPIEPPTTSIMDDKLPKTKDPFINPPPSEIVCHLSATHSLLLNKFCVYRPMLLITTREFERQGDDLNLEDWRAVWGVLEKLENDTDETQSRTEYVGAFNCGVNAGCSQGHKHLQLFPKPVVKKDGWRGLWPEKSLFMGDKGIVSNIPDVPFEHYVFRIQKNATFGDVHTIYNSLLEKTNKTLKKASAGASSDYNVAFTRQWMVLIPRREMKVVEEQPFGANALGMLGLVGLRSEEERKVWNSMGWKAHVTKLGFAKHS